MMISLLNDKITSERMMRWNAYTTPDASRDSLSFSLSQLMVTDTLACRSYIIIWITSH